MGNGSSLRIEGLITGYGKSQVINGVSLKLQWGEVATIIGPNGAGKSTLLKAMLGVLPFREGKMYLSDQDVTGKTTPFLLRQGIALVPEGGRVFAPLTVHENLEMGGLLLSNRKSLQQRIEEMYALFPQLAERRQQLAGTLSGGERQMLAIARGLMIKPRILLLDEPSLGLAPLYVELVMSTLRKLTTEQQMAVCLVEQNARAALSISDQAYVLNVGQVVHQSNDPNALLESGELLRFLEA